MEIRLWLFKLLMEHVIGEHWRALFLWFFIFFVIFVLYEFSFDYLGLGSTFQIIVVINLIWLSLLCWSKIVFLKFKLKD